ncbi:MAG: CopG family ribbon-helix-helix protein [Burkholderiales bacterium]
MASTTTLKIPAPLKARIARLARETRQSPHSLMLAAVEREVEKAERMRAFVREAQAADRAIDAGASVYAAADVHAWMTRLVRNPKARRPKPWRG